MKLCWTKQRLPTIFVYFSIARSSRLILITRPWQFKRQFQKRTSRLNLTSALVQMGVILLYDGRWWGHLGKGLPMFFFGDFLLLVGFLGSWPTYLFQISHQLYLTRCSCRMNYQQEYIRDEYVELKVPAGKDHNGEPTFLLDPNHLHIWPRHSFMLIALPNKVRFPMWDYFDALINISQHRIKPLLVLCLHLPPNLIAFVAPTLYWHGLNYISLTRSALSARKGWWTISWRIPEALWFVQR